MSEAIETRNGKAYAVVDTWLYSQPIRRRAGWELDCDPSIISDGARAEYIGAGRYFVECGPMRQRLVVRIAGGEGAPPSWSEESPIDPPKTRAPVRYDGCAGRWERLTRKGWQ
ncbi:MAG: hypothetical protein ABFD77_00055 [Thermotogota bacterium]